MLTVEEAKNCLVISKFDLDSMCAMQPDVFFAVSEEYAKASSVRDLAKERIAQIDAELSFEFRKESERLGEKVTEAKLQQLVTTHVSHQTVFQEWLDAKFQADVWGALKESFGQRVFMIKELCNLALANYYSNVEVKDTTAKSRDLTHTQIKNRREAMNG